MAEDGAGITANRRRQAYYRNRRSVQRAATDGSALAVDRMDTDVLWAHCRGLLTLLEMELEEGSSIKNFKLCQDALACLRELHVRGDQLKLFGE